MKKYIKYIIMIAIVILIIVMAIVVSNKKENGVNNNEKFKIVTSFYPIYIMTANITEGAQNIELVNMTDNNVGCIHNYTLTTADMKKIDNADLLIQNGLGLENFIDKVVLTNKNLKVIDSSKNLENLIKEENEINPHIWTSISNCILQVENITQALKEENPENAEIYEINSKAYIQRLSDLKQKYDNELNLKNQTAVTLNESFAYLGRDLGLNLTVIHTSHEENSISAEVLKNIINTMKNANGKIIIVDRDDDIKNAQTIANETGAEIYVLDSGTRGSMDKEAYINYMKNNLEQLKTK